MEDLSGYRRVFAGFVAKRAGIAAESEIVEVFASTPRERFVAGPPWRISADNGRYFEVPGEFPAFLYQDMPVCLDEAGKLPNGQPSLHARCLDALAVKGGETVVHVGAGTGYYTTLLAKLVGEKGSLDAYEIDPVLARRAEENLAEFPYVRVHCVSGAEGQLPSCDVLYVNAGATAPMAAWFDALKVGGRMCFPLTPDKGRGGTLLLTKKDETNYSAKFLSRAIFVACLGARDAGEAERLAKAFQDGEAGLKKPVRSLHRNDAPDESCWFAGSGWWLSSEPLAEQE